MNTTKEQLIAAKKEVERLQDAIDAQDMAQKRVQRIIVKVSLFQNGEVDRTFTIPADAARFLTQLQAEIDKIPTPRQIATAKNGGIYEPHGY